MYAYYCMYVNLCRAVYVLDKYDDSLLTSLSLASGIYIYT